MSETTMPAAEAAVAPATSDLPAQAGDERGSYEFAFHILPTVAEGEVPTVFEQLKAIIEKDGGDIFDEEAPERFDLAYDIVQHIEGKNRKFSSAYFGWVRFKAPTESVTKITGEIEARGDMLRYLLIRLSRVEEENPFRFHEALKDEKMVTTVDESKLVPDFTTVSGAREEDATDQEESKEEEKKEEGGEVDEEALDEALEKKDL